MVQMQIMLLLHWTYRADLIYNCDESGLTGMPNGGSPVFGVYYLERRAMKAMEIIVLTFYMVNMSKCVTTFYVLHVQNHIFERFKQEHVTAHMTIRVDDMVIQQ